MSTENGKVREEKSDIVIAVKALMNAAQDLQKEPENVEGIEDIIANLKTLLHQEKQTIAEKKTYMVLAHQNSERRKKLENIDNLIQYLENQIQKANKVSSRHGVRRYVANVSNKVLGHEVRRIGQSMASKLQSWLDQQSVMELSNIINNGSEEEQVNAISSFESAIRKGFDPLLQDAILSTGLVEKLVALLEPRTTAWRIQKESAVAILALLGFHKDVFVSLVLMSKLVENLLSLMNSDIHPEENVLFVLIVMKGFLMAGETVFADEIFYKKGIPEFVSLLDHKSQVLQHAALECVLELTYYGRVEVVEEMLRLEVVKKLAILQKINAPVEMQSFPNVFIVKQERSSYSRFHDLVKFTSSAPASHDENGVMYPFADAVMKFTLNMAIGTGLRKRERRALKQEMLRQIKDILDDDTELANITAEILWAP